MKKKRVINAKPGVACSLVISPLEEWRQEFKVILYFYILCSIFLFLYLYNFYYKENWRPAWVIWIPFSTFHLPPQFICCLWGLKVLSIKNTFLKNAMRVGSRSPGIYFFCYLKISYGFFLTSVGKMGAGKKASFLFL